MVGAARAVAAVEGAGAAVAADGLEGASTAPPGSDRTRSDAARPAGNRLVKRLSALASRVRFTQEVREARLAGDHLDLSDPGAASDRARRPRRAHFTLTVTMADMPGRSVWVLPTSLASSRIFTGTRWTTLTQLPVAFSGGRSEKRAPVPALIESTTP